MPLTLALLAPLIALLSLPLTPASSHHTPSSTITAQPEPAADKHRMLLARKVSDALLQNPCLQIDALIIHDGNELLVRSYMTPDALRVDAFRNNQLAGALAANGDRVQEYCPLYAPAESGLEYRNILIEFDPLEIDDGTLAIASPLLMADDLGCEFGTLMASWLDPDTGRVQWWADMILESDQLEDHSLNGMPCLTFQSVLTLPADEDRSTLTITHTIYISPETHLPLRWDTTQASDTYAIRRERHYTMTRHTDVPPDIQWTLALEQLRNVEPPKRIMHTVSK